MTESSQSPPSETPCNRRYPHPAHPASIVREDGDFRCPGIPTPPSEPVPDSLADMEESVIVNPSAVGNPDETPRVFVGAGLRRLLNPCEADAPSRGGYCGGVNGHHAPDCPVGNAPHAKSCRWASGEQSDPDPAQCVTCANAPTPESAS